MQSNHNLIVEKNVDATSNKLLQIGELPLMDDCHLLVLNGQAHVLRGRTRKSGSLFNSGCHGSCVVNNRMFATQQNFAGRRY